jgi:dTDP-4-amino-4,6-dideoxygalactose transaminase
MSTISNIPLVDLQAQHAEVADDVLAGFAGVLERTSFIGGPDVAAFEEEFAQYCGRTQCVGVANGTDAIELALRALGIGRGAEVILPANTFIATAEAVARAGADVVLVDCTNDTLLIDAELVAERVTPRTRAVIGVDLYGQIAPFDRLAEVIDRDRIALVEDAAQSQGARRHDAPIGTGVAAAATSFYPGKNLGAYGDAGAVVTDDGALAHTVRAIGGHGGTRRYEHDVLGFNSRLDTLQAVVLRAKLRRLDGWNEQRRAAAARYAALLQDVEEAVLPTTAAGNLPVWHLYVVRVPDRDRVLAELQAQGVGAGIHYPHPIHLTGAFAGLGLGAGSFPVAEQSAPELLTLPLFPHITEAQQERVVEVLLKALR